MILPFGGPLVEDLAAAGVEVLTGPLAVLRRDTAPARFARDLGRMSRALRRLVAGRDVALVHRNTSVITPVPLPAGVRRVVHAREWYADEHRVLWPPLRAALRRADALVCVSHAVAAQFGPTARVIHDGLAVRHERAPRAAARDALGVDPDAFVVAVLGRVSDWKGQDLLARALGEPALRGAIGLVAGDVWPGNERLLEGLTSLRLLGFRDDVGTVLGAADVVAVPSTRPDPLPNSALEAAAAGCCVVAAGHGGLPEILRDGETGRLVAPGDPTALARTLAELCDDPDQRARLGAAAAAEIPVRFAPERLLARTMALYDELLA